MCHWDAHRKYLVKAPELRKKKFHKCPAVQSFWAPIVGTQMKSRQSIDKVLIDSKGGF